MQIDGVFHKYLQVDKLIPLLYMNQTNQALWINPKGSRASIH